MDNVTALLENNTVLGIIIAGLGGVLVRWLDRTLRNNTDYFTQASQIRQELRDEISLLQTKSKQLEDEVKGLEDEIDEWKIKYYTLLENKIKNKLIDKKGE